MLRSLHLQSTKYLSSLMLALLFVGVAQASELLSLGTVQFSSVTAFDGKASHVIPGIVVVVSDQSHATRSFGITNEAGLLVMPLPPGLYTLEAFTQAGKRLNLEGIQKPFRVSKDQLTEVGIEIKP